MIPTMPARSPSRRCAHHRACRSGPVTRAAVLKIWARRHRDLSRARTQVACRLHAVLCELVPGGVSKEICAAQAAAILDEAEPGGAVHQARLELAAEFTADLRRIDARLRETRKKPAVAVRASGSTVTEVFGAGPVIAATVIGDVRDVSRFASRDRFAACNGTAPIEVSSGNRIICRLSLRGSRRLNHAIHMAAITQIRYKHSDGRACYDKKIAGGKTPKEALRALKRQISDAICKHLKAGAARAAAASAQGPGGQPGTTLSPARPAHTPNAGSSAKPLPDLSPPYDARLTSRKGPAHTPGKRPHEPLDTEASFCRQSRFVPVAVAAMPNGIFCVVAPGLPAERAESLRDLPCSDVWGTDHDACPGGAVRGRC
jgi:Transposase IS116/IS110/IS902 family